MFVHTWRQSHRQGVYGDGVLDGAMELMPSKCPASQIDTTLNFDGKGSFMLAQKRNLRSLSLSRKWTLRADRMQKRKGNSVSLGIWVSYLFSSELHFCLFWRVIDNTLVKRYRFRPMWIQLKCEQTLRLRLHVPSMSLFLWPAHLIISMDTLMERMGAQPI